MNRPLNTYANEEEYVAITYRKSLVMFAELEKTVGVKKNTSAMRKLYKDNKFKNIPIIMVTARSQDEDKLIGEETGADEYITKPFEFSDVLEKINKYLA